MTDIIADEEYRQPISLTVGEVQQLISDEMEKIESEKHAYLSMLTKFNEDYNKYLTDLKSAIDDKIKIQRLEEQFDKSIPEIIKVNLERHKLHTKSEYIDIRQFIIDEQKRVNEDFKYDLELVEVSEPNGTQNALRDKIKENEKSGKLHIYILHSTSPNSEEGKPPLSHYSIVTQFGNAIQATVLDPTGLVTPANSVFDKFIYEEGIDLKRVVSRTQFKTNGDCELLSVYMASHLIRLAMFNLEEDIFGQPPSNTITTKSIPPKCPQITLRHPMLYLFSEQFSDYCESTLNSLPIGEGIKDATAEKRIGFIKDNLILALQNQNPTENPQLFISSGETIQQRAIVFLRETAQFIERNPNLYGPQTVQAKLESKKVFTNRIKTYSQTPDRLKFSYANKLYLQYRKEQIHTQEQSSEALLVPGLGVSIDNMSNSTTQEVQKRQQEEQKDTGQGRDGKQ